MQIRHRAEGSVAGRCGHGRNVRVDLGEREDIVLRQREREGVQARGGHRAGPHGAHVERGQREFVRSATCEGHNSTETRLLLLGPVDYGEQPVRERAQRRALRRHRDRHAGHIDVPRGQAGQLAPEPEDGRAVPGQRCCHIGGVQQPTASIRGGDEQIRRVARGHPRRVFPSRRPGAESAPQHRGRQARARGQFPTDILAHRGHIRQLLGAPN
mmetsp:Transcript_91711/g.256287  ORF Transcript_91711/g.256287 Transcript_91711/m.256287 type:complete len:213 (-) Transcript_91711:2010-2648(-)